MSNSKLPPPSPMAGPGQPVDWMFAFKFNTASFPGCSDEGVIPKVGTPGIFGGKVDEYKSGHSQNYVFASSKNPTLQRGNECLGATLKDPLGATFGQVYNTPGYFYVLWNDQFYGNPIKTEPSPWGHSKGMVAWNDDGEGFVLQVSTPSWPASGSKKFPRQNDGNTLGCINDDDIEVSQHFFALKINKNDLVQILKGLQNASVVTKNGHPEIVQNGGPQDVQDLVKQLGTESTSKDVFVATLSSGVKFISKPSKLEVPPWQLVSAQLNGADLRVASWWTSPAIYSTTAATPLGCWPNGLGKPGAVQIATTGNWQGKSIGLQGGEGTNFNHAKIGVTTSNGQTLAIFGDMNQQGALGPDYAYKGQKCDSSQNGRGGTFYVVDNAGLHASISALIKGESAPTTPPAQTDSSGNSGSKEKPKAKAKSKSASAAKKAKPAAKKAAKKATKKAAKKAVKKADKKATKKTTKKAGKNVAKKAVKKTVKKAAKKATKKVAKKATQKVAKKAAKKAISKPAKKVGKKAVKKKATRKGSYKTSPGARTKKKGAPKKTARKGKSAGSRAARKGGGSHW